MKLEPVFVELLPKFNEIKAGQLWISHKHRTINLRCPCGCDGLTVLTIHPSRWHVYFDGKSISLCGESEGSVWAHSSCGSHYLIKNNEVIWLNSINPNRHKEYEEFENSRMVEQETVENIELTWIMRAKRKINTFVIRIKQYIKNWIS